MAVIKAIAILLISVIVSAAGTAQTVESTEKRAPQANWARAMPGPVVGETGLKLADNQSTQSQIGELLKQMRVTKDSRAKHVFKGEIQQLLSIQYDQKMDSYEQHLNELKNRLETMRVQLHRRRAAKEQIVDLHTRLLLAKANGLGRPALDRSVFQAKVSTKQTSSQQPRRTGTS